MKLKRILSLALSGVLAVSMLTACGFGGNADKLPGKNEVTPVSMTLAVNSAINSKPKFESDNTLSKAVQSAASTLTANQVKTVDTIAPQAILDMVRQMTYTSAKGELDNPAAWSAFNSDASFSTVRIYKGDYDTATVANKIKTDVVDKIALTSDKATKGNDFTCDYDCYVAGCKVTVAEAAADGSDVTVWVVGIQIDRDAKAVKS
ncbi:hypothetical protein [Faecalibacterium sp. An122]|uniref:hypothetical protein n=1 Tax=Faecalibacterium sp. An122 TaxID=1965551 RepID=UPI000B385EDF|nr:hypothetical protein [Faecalibacterium sp. An122]OUQ37760.1 hypothetical protein B5E67_07315 [Faecalibacterium sp. An122]